MPDKPSKEPETVLSAALPKPRHPILTRLRAYFLAGILITAPIAITLAVAFWLIDFVDSRVVPLIPVQWNPDTYLHKYFGVEFSLPGIGVVILFIAITLIGWLTANFLGRFLVRTGENIVARMPVVRSVYGAVKQIMETVFRNQSEAFRQAVLVEYPRRGLWTIAFITGETEGEVQNLTEEDIVNIYVPTTPNPTSGFLLFVPRKDVVILDMSVDDAFKMVVSVGLVVPEDGRSESEQRSPKVSARTYDSPALTSESERPRRAG